MGKSDQDLRVPLDGSIVAEGALPYAEALADALGTGIRLVWIEPHGTAQRPASSSPDQRTVADTYLSTVVSRLEDRGRRTRALIESGQPSDRIAQIAEQPDVALVAIATHGRGGVKRWFEGSVAERVLATCDKPIFLTVPSDLPGGQPPVELRRIMVPLDGSPAAEAAIPLATETATGAGATLLLVRVLSPLSAPGVLVPNERAWESQRTNAADTYLNAVRARLPASLPSEGLVVLGLGAPDGLVRFAEAAAIDLTIMSSHRHEGLRRIVMGSVADEVVRAGLPTLLVPPTRPAG